MGRRTSLLSLVLGLGLIGGTPPRPALPRPDHIVIVIEENKLYSRIIGNPQAPYIHALSARGAALTSYFALTHPPAPNSLALFSGSFQGVTTNTSPAPGSPFDTPNLGTG